MIKIVARHAPNPPSNIASVGSISLVVHSGHSVRTGADVDVTALVAVVQPMSALSAAVALGRLVRRALGVGGVAPRQPVVASAQVGFTSTAFQMIASCGAILANDGFVSRAVVSVVSGITQRAAANIGLAAGVVSIQVVVGLARSAAVAAVGGAS